MMGLDRLDIGELKIKGFFLVIIFHASFLSFICIPVLVMYCFVFPTVGFDIYFIIQVYYSHINQLESKILYWSTYILTALPK